MNHPRQVLEIKTESSARASGISNPQVTSLAPNQNTLK